MTCDDIYCNKSTIAKQVKVVLSKVLSDYGYEILDALTTDIRPAEDVVRSMNEINASKRMKVVRMAYVQFTMLQCSIQFYSSCIFVFCLPPHELVKT